MYNSEVADVQVASYYDHYGMTTMKNIVHYGVRVNICHTGLGYQLILFCYFVFVLTLILICVSALGLESQIVLIQ